MTASISSHPVRARVATGESVSITLPLPQDAAVNLSIDQALEKAKSALLSIQKPDGHWCGELQGDSILESEYILLKWILGQESDPALPKVTKYLQSLQMDNGGWNLFPGEPRRSLNNRQRLLRAN